MKLNVGSGKDYREGYINLEPNEKFRSDLKIDMRSAIFEANTLDEILVQDSLDHIPYTHALEMVEKFYKWLKPNGLLNIHLPNFDWCARRALAGDHEAMCWLYGSDGVRAYYETNIIRWSYTPKTMRKILEDCGFVIIHEEPTCMEYGFRMMATKRE